MATELLTYVLNFQIKAWKDGQCLDVAGHETRKVGEYVCVCVLYRLVPSEKQPTFFDIEAARRTFIECA